MGQLVPSAGREDGIEDVIEGGPHHHDRGGPVPVSPQGDIRGVREKRDRPFEFEGSYNFV